MGVTSKPLRASCIHNAKIFWTDCDFGFYGQYCENQCHCKQGSCNQVTGLGCEECAGGYTGDTCSDKQDTETSITLKTTTSQATITESKESTTTLSTQAEYMSPMPCGDIQTLKQRETTQDNTRKLIASSIQCFVKLFTYMFVDVMYDKFSTL